MAKATWSGVTIAESDRTIVVEGNHYFPREAVNAAYLKPSDDHTTCHWKGIASYYDVVVDGQTIAGGAWYYPDTKEAADRIRDYIAFWRGVTVEA
jgi:uncharacterized protein (DUF427 family)